jgi:transcriptional regulator with XRE-family HTH domain
VNFGDKLKKLRTGQKLSQRELADRIGVAKSVISYYESGDRYPSYDVLVKMAHLFHVTTDYLLDIDKVRTVDVSNLTEQQIDVIVQMIKLLENNNK